MTEIESNLENINRDNAIYEIRERILVELFNESRDIIVRTDVLKPNTVMSTILTDLYYLHYSLIPFIRMDSNPNRVLEIFRRAMLSYINTDFYQKIRIKTELNDELSTFYAILFMKNFMNILSRAEGRSNNASVEKAMSNLKNQDVNRLARLLKDASKQAEEDLDRISKVLKIVNFGDKEGKYVKTLKLLDLIKRVDNAENILKFTEGLINKMPKFYSKSKEESKIGTEIGGYKLLRDIMRAVPKEIALPDDIMLVKLTSQGLLARKKVYPRAGVLYVLLDKSGSMAGLKTIWSRSVALALFKRSMLENRDFYLRFFDFKIYRLLKKPEEIMSDILRVKSNGGTDIQKAILTAVVDLRSVNKKTNTIVIITDGESKIARNLLKNKLSEVNAKLISIFVGENRESENVNNLMEISDKRFFVRPSEKDALTLIQEI